MATCLSYTYIPCCGGHPITLARYDSDENPVTFPSLPGVYVYDIGALPITDAFGHTLLPGLCYQIQLGTFSSNDCNIDLVPSPQITDFSTTVYTTCSEAIANDDCTTCPRKTVFTPCCGDAPISFLGDPSFTAIGATYVYPVGSPLEFGLGGVLLPGSCYTVSLQAASLAEAALLTPGPTLGDLTFAGKSCNLINSGITCLPCTHYYEITNCEDPLEVYCTTSNLSAYINNLIADPEEWPVIQVLEYPDKCFYVEQVVSCSGVVPITPNPIVEPFIGCYACQQSLIVYYELINCNDEQVVIYTSTDLSGYVNKYITLDEYGNDCFYVSIAQTLVPSDVPVTPTGESFETCLTCSSQKYLLEDCTGTLPDIITITDLSAYVGEIIVLETCPDVCWIVTETDLLGDVEVNVISTFKTCEDCTTPPVTQCVSFTNKSEKAQNVFVALPDNTQVILSIPAGTTSPKACYFSWDIGTSLLVPIVYGDCVDNICPEVPKPKRKVTPGYNTPACTPEYYEKVECNFSEWMYKDVLEQRYGISNCCPEELMKWEIKHEMLMLDSLINPDYTCQPPIDCGCAQPTTCGCSCNSGN